MTTATLKGGLAAIALAAALLGQAYADPVEDTLILNDEIEMITVAPAPEHLEGVLGDVVRSGWLYREDATRDVQRDDFENPAILNVEQAATAWETVEGTEGKACASCHEGPESMAGVRPVMPKIHEESGQLWSMEQYINDCRVNRMGAEEWKWDGDEMRNMTALISSVSRGMPVNVQTDGPYAPFWEQGKEIYYTRYGQLELSCANCHEDNNGNYIRADHLSQGQTNGFPVYRFNTNGLVSLHNRFRGCIRDTRAEPYAIGSPEFTALELYVASRGNGLSVEGPAVRQ
jgi:sulfur-oxidizing protein SoxA